MAKNLLFRCLLRRRATPRPSQASKLMVDFGLGFLYVRKDVQAKLKRINFGPFADFIKRSFRAWIKSITKILEDAGVSPSLAHQRAERIIALLQGSLVLTRVMGTTKPLRDFLANLPDDLLGRNG